MAKKLHIYFQTFHKVLSWKYFCTNWSDCSGLNYSLLLQGQPKSFWLCWSPAFWDQRCKILNGLHSVLTLPEGTHFCCSFDEYYCDNSFHWLLIAMKGALNLVHFNLLFCPFFRLYFDFLCIGNREII